MARRRTRKTAQQRRFAAAARACRGRKLRAFRACVRKKLRKRKRR